MFLIKLQSGNFVLKLPIVFQFVMFSAVSAVSQLASAVGATALINENLKIWFGLAHSNVY